MISSRKHQLVIALILGCICVPILGAEPNEAKAELKFESSSETVQWIDRRGKVAEGPMRPTHAAEFFINFTDIAISNPREVSMVLQTSVGQTISPKQREFLTTPTVSTVLAAILSFDKRLKGHYHYRLYAVSQDDAKKMCKALIEASTNNANKRLAELKRKLQEYQERIAEIKKQISKMEAEIKNAQPNLDRLKKETQYLHSGKAEEAISEFNKMLNTLKIELSGIRSRLQTIEIYKAKLGKEISGEHRFKLEQMFIEQMIELKAGEARKNTVIDLRNEARSFYNLDRKLDKLKSTKYNLGNDLTRLEPVLGQIEEELTNPSPDMLPPKVYQNKVTIYPVTIYPVRAGE